MVFQKKFNEIEDNHSISLLSQKSSDYDSEFKQILSKLLTKGKKRLNFESLDKERILRKKSVEINIFDKLIQKNDIKGK